MGSLVVWWLVLEALGLLALPLTFRLFSRRFNHGYAFAKILALLIVSYVSWLLTHSGILAFHVSLPLTLVLFAIANAAIAWQSRSRLFEWIRGPGLRAMVIADAFWTF